MTEVQTMSNEETIHNLPTNLVNILQRDSVRTIMQYLHYTQNKINKTMIELGLEINASENSFISVDPRSEITSVNDTSNKKKNTKEKKEKKTSKKDAVKKVQSDIQMAYRTFMTNNTNMDNTNGIKYKLSMKYPDKAKGEVNRLALKEISTTWKEMSAEEKGCITSICNKNQLKAEVSHTPVHVSDNGSSCDSDSDEEVAECEEMLFGNKTYAVEGGPEPRLVYTLNGIEVGTYTTENGFQPC
jgi:hypothetical protein